MALQQWNNLKTARGISAEWTDLGRGEDGRWGFRLCARDGIETLDAVGFGLSKRAAKEACVNNALDKSCWTRGMEKASPPPPPPPPPTKRAAFVSIYNLLVWSDRPVDIDLSNKQLTTADVRALHMEIFANPVLLQKLHSIDLRFNQLTDDAVGWLAHYARSPNCECVDVRGNPISRDLPLDAKILHD